TRAHADRERARDDLQVQPALIAGGDLVEAVTAIREYAREDVEAPGRALGVGASSHPWWQAEVLDQRDQVGPVALQCGPVAQIDALEGQVGHLFLDGRVAVWQEAAAQRPCMLAESQID